MVKQITVKCSFGFLHTFLDKKKIFHLFTQPFGLHVMELYTFWLVKDLIKVCQNYQESLDSMYSTVEMHFWCDFCSLTRFLGT